jgi:hypothetical protein
VRQYLYPPPRHRCVGALLPQPRLPVPHPFHRPTW